MRVKIVVASVIGAEVDLVLAPDDRRRAFEVNFGLAPKIGKGYHHALADLQISDGKVVYTGNDSHRPATMPLSSAWPMR